MQGDNKKFWWATGDLSEAVWSLATSLEDAHHWFRRVITMTINISPKTPNSIFTPSEVQSRLLRCACSCRSPRGVPWDPGIRCESRVLGGSSACHRELGEPPRGSSYRWSCPSRCGDRWGCGHDVQWPVLGLVTRVVYTLGIAGWFTGNSSEGCKKTRKHQLSSILPEMGPTNRWVCQIILESSTGGVFLPLFLL